MLTVHLTFSACLVQNTLWLIWDKPPYFLWTMAGVNHTRITRIYLKSTEHFQSEPLYVGSVILFFFNPFIPGHAVSVLFPEHFDYTLFLASSFLSVTPSPHSYPDFPINPITIRGMLNRDRATSDWGREKKIRLGWDESEQRRQDGAEWWHRRQQLSKTDREAVREGSLACNTHTFKHKLGDNGLCTATDLVRLPLH